MEPLVSVIIPVYNSALYIEDAINSVLKQEVEIEIIIVDDCSQDNLYEVILKYMMLDNFIYIRNEENQGVAESRNIGVSHAKGEFVAYLDSDDWWAGDKLRKQLETIRENNTVISFTGRSLMSAEACSLNKIIHVPNTINYDSLLRHNSIACSSVLLKREVALQFPMECSHLHEDYLNWLKILSKYDYGYGIDEPLLYYRMTPNGKSRNKLKSMRMTYGVYRTIGIGRISSLYYLVSHSIHGIRKYKIGKARLL